jgi:16S rRNA (cytosine967-C5)-methyltransferase
MALRAVEHDRAYATKALEAVWRQFPGADRGARAGATDLVLGTLRWRGIIDARLDDLLPRRLASLDDLTRQALRVGAFEILGPRPTATHAAVHTAVAVVRRLRGHVLGGLANAVLRRLAAQGGPARDARLALPPWLYDSLADAWGGAAAEAVARRSLEPAGRSLRVNRRRATTAEAAAGIPGAAPAPHGPWILRLPPGSGDLREHPLVAAGKATVQEEGAFLVAEALPLQPGARVLDACAGRGGKTCALAERAPEGARITAADVNPAKLARLGEEAARLGLALPERAAVDWTVGTGDVVGPFDAILVDAPCSGTGTLGRRPEIRWRLAPADVPGLCALQEAILGRTAGLVAPGGVLLYAVCSLLREEGEDRVRDFLAGHPGWTPVADAFASPPWRRLALGAALLPHEADTDGFFAALLRRTGPAAG